MRMIIFIFSVLVINIPGFAQDAINKVQLKKLDGGTYKLCTAYKQFRVIVFLAPDCPISQQYTLPLKQLLLKYKNNLQVIGVFVGKNYADSEYYYFQEKYNIPFILLKDENYQLANQLNATVTPEVFLFNKNNHLLYSGAIDDRYVALGKSRIKVTENFLEEALDNYMNHFPIKNIYVKPVGCFIEKHRS